MATASPVWTSTSNEFGVQSLQANNNVAAPSNFQVGQSPYYGQVHPLGTIVQAQDISALGFGTGEFIYLQTNSTNSIGSLVVYDPVNKTTTLAPNTANLDQPVAVALFANTATSWGWFQINGVAQIKKNASPVSKNAVVYLSSTAGSVAGTQANGKQIVNARSVASAASAASFVNVLIQRPFAQGQTS